MSHRSRDECSRTVRDRYAACSSRMEKSEIIDEVVANLGYHRKYAIQVVQPGRAIRHGPVKRPRPSQYAGLGGARLSMR
jgi:hypothetical protein